MARGINKVIIVGNLGQDPETRTFPDGGSITNVSIATSEAWTDKQTGQPQERTEWHRVVFRGRLAEIAAQYLRKGSKVYIEGSLRTSKYQDKQTGADRYSTEVMAREMQMLDSRQDNQGGGFAAQNQQGGYQQPQQPQQSGYQQAPVAQQNYAAPAAVAPPVAAQPAAVSPAPQAVPQSAPQAAAPVPAAPAPQAAPQPMQQQAAPQPPSAPAGQPAAANSFDDFDDDIPF